MQNSIIKQYFQKFEILVIDLDNTLIYEKDFLYLAYKHIAAQIAVNKAEKESISKFLINTFEKEGRKNLFNKMLGRFDKSIELNTILGYMRETKLNKLQPIPQTVNFINNFLPAIKTTIVFTNGNPIQQRNKLNHLDMQFLPGKVITVLANEVEAKPSAAALRKDLDISKKTKTIYIGNCWRDQLAAEEMRICYWNVQQVWDILAEGESHE